MTVADRLALARVRFANLQRDAAIDYPPAPDDVKFIGPFTADLGFYDGVFVAVKDSLGNRVAEIYDLKSGVELVQRLNNAWAVDDWKSE